AEGSGASGAPFAGRPEEQPLNCGRGAESTAAPTIVRRANLKRAPIPPSATLTIMTKPERWIVFSLFFFALGLGMRHGLPIQDKFHADSSLAIETVRCKALEIVGADGKPRVKIGTSTNGGGLIETAANDGTVQAELETNPSGALLSLLDHNGKVALRLGHEA